jgi:acyl-coenzyme A synthetase/AMP-(fatty) acid ligase
LPLALGKISLENIPFKSAMKYGDKILFTCDVACKWEVPALQLQYADNFNWSAKRIHLTVGYVAAMLQQHGVKNGDRVIILKKNHFDIHLFNLSIIRAGGIACPVNGKFESFNIRPYINNTGATVLISDCATVHRVINQNEDFGIVEKIILADRRCFYKENGNEFEKIIQLKYPQVQLIWIEEAMKEIYAAAPEIRCKKDAPLYFVHSSGTTGFPKAVVLRNGKQSHAVRGWLCYVHVNRNTDKGYLAVPNNHQAVILSFNSLLLLGLKAHWICACDREEFKPEMVIKELSKGGYTGFFGFPITYTLLKEIDLNKHDLNKMRFWGTTADASHESIMGHFVTVGNAFKSLGIPIKGSVFMDAQGSSEVGTPSVLRYVTRFTKKFERRIGRPGFTPFGPEIRIALKCGTPVQMGEVGRLEVKGKTLFDSYWNNPTLTAQSFSNNWFFTGDVACFNNDGNIIQLDREVDVIHSINGDIYSLPIEEKVHKHPAIFDACVYGERQEDGTQLPAIAIALREGFSFSNDEMMFALNQLLTKKEKLHRCDIMPWNEFPIGVTGKTLKRIFRERSEIILQKLQA